MKEIVVSAAEKAGGILSPENRTRAVAAIHADGYVVLHGVVDTAHLDVLQERMLADLEKILARPDAPFNFNTGNVQQDAPPFAPFLFDDILRNDLVISVTKAVLGPNLKMPFYSGNTALPGGTRQPVHPDVAQLWQDLAHPTPAFGLVINVPVVDVSPANGSTEFWPGTHHDTTYDIHGGSARIPQEVLDRRAAQMPPFQPTIPRGSVVIRDIRMWHAGMPNHTDVPRPMLAMIHWCSWWQSGEIIVAPRESESFFQHPDLHFVTRYVDGAVDHTQNNQAYDLKLDR